MDVVKVMFSSCVSCTMCEFSIILVHKLCILYIFTNLFIGCGKNRVCHRRPVDAIEMGQRSICCQIDAAGYPCSIAFLYVAPLLTNT